MNLPPLPEGICRDDTQHGKLYFTEDQIREYGQACADAERNRLESDEYTTPQSTSPEVERLFGIFGMTK